jgi:acyl-CoA reductase-like NAD-dependent aldehyde dehydrogenase
VVFTGSVETGEQVARDAGLETACWSSAATARRSCWPTPTSDRAADAADHRLLLPRRASAAPRPERILVHSLGEDAFVERWSSAPRELNGRRPHWTSHRHGPASHAGRRGAHQGARGDAVATGRDGGARAAATASASSRRSSTGVTIDMRIAQEETFGPVAPIMTFDTPDEALRIANETEFGLTAAVFTNDLAARLARPRRCATAPSTSTRPTNYWDQMAPFGGAKKSGAGRELAGWIFDAVTETKQITFRPGLSHARLRRRPI